MNVLEIMQSHKDVMKKYFVHDEATSLAAGGILLLKSYYRCSKTFFREHTQHVWNSFLL